MNLSMFLGLLNRLAEADRLAASEHDPARREALLCEINRLEHEVFDGALEPATEDEACDGLGL